MADIPAANWDETDANNDDAAPDGFPEGMAPSGVNNGARAIMGAAKRFWNRINPTKTTAGTTTAYTLTYDVAPAAYVNGEIYSFLVDQTCGAEPTLNVNTLGAVPLRMFGGNLLPGALGTGQIVQARYNSSAGTFDLITTQGWNVLATATPSGAATVDFEDIPAAVNNLMAMVELDPSVDGASISLRTAGADGSFDAGASDYFYIDHVATTLDSSSVTAETASSIVLATDVDNGSFGFGGRLETMNIQAATNTKFLFQTTYLSSAGTLGVHIGGMGVRSEADRITGLRFLPSSGTVTGRITLFASV